MNNPANYCEGDPEQASSDVTGTSDEPYTHELPTQSNNNRKRNIIIGVVGLIVVVGVAVGVVMATSGGSSSSSTTNSNQSPDVNVPGPTPIPTKPTSDVYGIIESIALENGSEFTNSDSYQSKALSWLEANHDGLEDESMLIQRYALACLYYNTYATPNTITDAEYGDPGKVPPGWKRSDNWLDLSGDNDECNNWYGIKCDDSSRKVTEISLFDNRLTGYMPDEIILLKDSLEVLELGENSFLTGKSRVIINNNYWMGQLTNLRKLYYPFCKFESNMGVPTELGLLTNLEEYDGSYNIYEGSLDGSTFSKMTSLIWLDISGGKYESSLPDEIFILPVLEDFFVNDAFIHDDISRIIPKLSSNIAQFTIDQNPKIIGELPTSIDSYQFKDKIELLSFSFCNINGEIPPIIGDLSNLKKLFLNGNNFDGTIPSELSRLNQLTELELQSNNLKGIMPMDICHNRKSGELSDGTITKLIVDCEPEPTLSDPFVTEVDIQCSVPSCCTACGEQYKTN